MALQVWGWGAIALASISLVIALWGHPAVLLIGGLVLGLTLGSASQIGMVAFSPSIEGRDYGLRVVSGTEVKFEFLRQLVGPGERNYARITSAMSKYDLDPLASNPGSETPYLPTSKNWLLIEPDAAQLPAFEEVMPHLNRGGNLTILFSPDQAAASSVREWLSSLGIFLQNTMSLAVAEDPKFGLLNRSAAVLLRNTRAVTGALPSSLLKARESGVLLQSYTARPTSLPRTSGLLTIGFSAEQFSDDAVGEVWEGIHPASLGRHREHQLAAALQGKDLLGNFPDNLVAPIVDLEIAVSMPAYALFENGKVVLSGKFGQPFSGPSSPSENPAGYLINLRNSAVIFIRKWCPNVTQKNTCKKRLLGSDYVEWMVTWVANKKGQINTVELLHERRFSGMGSTVNVVFGQ